eukprot:CAMPEP_0196818578 /NCGR_PEP_ID=MMETSP1362-20130617/66303_1 /TAXON_ID=163516 /ORGANISM="Leptocylindrus danicus, Strain CCMP1856" /LENGTH=74 /DNA_ID=CAMNT_0042196729 /DNA_START=110 /DNA_END=334 /DNA_ORIENTATION=+
MTQETRRTSNTKSLIKGRVARNGDILVAGRLGRGPYAVGENIHHRMYVGMTHLLYQSLSNDHFGLYYGADRRRL